MLWGPGGTDDPDVRLRRRDVAVLDMEDANSFAVDGKWDGGQLRLGDLRLWRDPDGLVRARSLPTGEPLHGFDRPLLTPVTMAGSTLPDGTYSRGQMVLRSDATPGQSPGVVVVEAGPVGGLTAVAATNTAIGGAVNLAGFETNKVRAGQFLKIRDSD